MGTMTVHYYVEVQFSCSSFVTGLLLGSLIACQEARPSKAGSPRARVDSSASASSNGAGGEAGGNAASESVGGTRGGSNATGSAGAAGAGATGGEDAVSACAGNRAFAAVSGVFLDPTPAQLAARLSATSYAESPISFVLFADNASSDVALAVSYTVGRSGARRWPASHKPSHAPAWLEGRGFGSTAAAENGWMLVADAPVTREVRLRNVRVAATTDAECTRGTATLVAVVPGEWSKVLNDIAPGTVPDAATDRGGRAPDVTISAEFGFELVEFEFGGAP